MRFSEGIKPFENITGHKFAMNSNFDQKIFDIVADDCSWLHKEYGINFD